MENISFRLLQLNHEPVEHGKMLCVRAISLGIHGANDIGFC